MNFRATIFGATIHAIVLAAVLGTLCSSVSAEVFKRGKEESRMNHARTLHDLVGNAAPTPIVLMHGIVASKKSLAWVKAHLEKEVPGVFVYNAEVGNGVISSFSTPMAEQVDELCASIKSEPKLSGGFHIVGMSQGGLIARGVIEMCPGLPPVKTFVSWVSPQAGQFGVPVACDTDCPHVIKQAMNVLVGDMPYWSYFQNHLSFCQYWKEPSFLDKYQKDCVFLPDLNNERPKKNVSYKERITALEHYVLVKSTVDSVLTPRETGWFEFYRDKEMKDILPLEESPWYVEDWLGLKSLDESKRLHKFSSPCIHQDYSSSCFEKAFEQVLPYLKI